MAAKAFVLIETGVGKSKEVANAIRSIEGVVSVNQVTGPYDVIAVLEVGDLNAVGALVTTRIHTISGVTRTVTCLAI